MKSGTKSPFGFTLIELMLSLTVATVLFGASLKLYRHFQQKMHSAKASEEALKIRRVFELYAGKYGCWPKGIFPVGQCFDLSRKKLDFKLVFSGNDGSTNPDRFNFIQEANLKTEALKEPLWIFLCDPGSPAADFAWIQLRKLRNRPTEWEQIDGLGCVFSYKPQQGEEYRILFEQMTQREREKNDNSKN